MVGPICLSGTVHSNDLLRYAKLELSSDGCPWTAAARQQLHVFGAFVDHLEIAAGAAGSSVTLLSATDPRA